MKTNGEYVARRGIEHLHPILQEEGVKWLKGVTTG